MKKLISAAAALAVAGLSATSALAYTPDSESMVYNLSGSIPSNCELLPEGSTNVTVDMLDYGNQQATAIVYSCNSPYELKIQSTNGGLKHAQSSLNLVYNVETFGFTDSIIPASQTFSSAAIKTTPGLVAKQTDWENILTNGGVQTGNLDIVTPALQNQGVAGEYSDTLTVTLTATL